MTIPPRTDKPAAPSDWLQLVNPPLALAAAAEALAGGLIAGQGLTLAGLGAAAAGSLLFAAGAVFGHYFDRDLDARRWPDRPLPSARVAPGAAWRAGWALLAAGLLLAAAAGAALPGVGLALVVVLHAAVTKGIWGAGFITVATARALNLLLGLWAVSLTPGRFAAAAFPVFLHALGWAVLRDSRSPHSPPTAPFVALVHMAAAVSALLYQAGTQFSYRTDSLPFLLLYLSLLLPRAVAAAQDPRRARIGEATEYGFLALPLLEAGLAAGHAGILAGVLPALLAVPLYRLLLRFPSWS